MIPALVLGSVGCGKKTENIPITTISQSTEDDDPEDNLSSSLSQDIPEYEVDLPEDLSSFTIAIWGDVYEIPEEYEDFTALGWEYTGSLSKEIAPESYSEGEVFEKDGTKMTVDLANPDTTAKSIEDCVIGGIHIDTSTAEGQAFSVTLPGGIVLQDALLDEVQTAYGQAKDQYRGDGIIRLTYEYGIYQKITLSFLEDTEVLYGLDLQNMYTRAHKEQLENVSDEETPEAASYEAPEADGTRINDFIIRYDDVLYHLPVPVSAFLEHGWKINEKESDAAVLNGKYGYVTLEKGSQKLFCTVHNYGSDATTVRNCFATTLYGDLDTTKVPISVANGITLGISEDEFLKKAGDAKYEKEENEDSNVTFYTFYTDETKLDYTQVGIDNDLHLVRSIKAVHNQPDAPEEENGADEEAEEDAENITSSSVME